MMKFPKWLFVSKRDDDGTEWFNADEEQMAVIEDDGPTLVASYQLVKVNKLQKLPHITPLKTRSRKKE
jgi:hypothetical protein